jgi:hypothetical protein
VSLKIPGAVAYAKRRHEHIGGGRHDRSDARRHRGSSNDADQSPRR